MRHQQHTGALAPGAASTAAAMQQGFRIPRQFGVNNQIQFRQINAARRDIGRDTNA